MNYILPLHYTSFHPLKWLQLGYQVQQKDEEGEFLQMAALQQNMRRDGWAKDTRGPFGFTQVDFCRDFVQSGLVQKGRWGYLLILKLLPICRVDGAIYIYNGYTDTKSALCDTLQAWCW